MIILTIIVLALPVVLVVAVFSRKGIKAEASVLIKKPRDQVFDYLAILKNQENFNAWLMTDPQMKKTYAGNDGQPGFMMAWDSKNPKDGKASQRLVSLAALERIEVELAFEKPLKSVARYSFEIKAGG